MCAKGALNVSNIVCTVFSFKDSDNKSIFNQIKNLFENVIIIFWSSSINNVRRCHKVSHVDSSFVLLIVL